MDDRWVSPLNPKSDWIIKDVPDLQFIDQNLWDRVKTRQAEIQIKYKDQIDGIVMSIANGTDIPSMHDLLFKLEDQKQSLEDFLEAEPPKLPDLHPGLADIYRDRVLPTWSKLSMTPTPSQKPVKPSGR